MCFMHSYVYIHMLSYILVSELCDLDLAGKPIALSPAGYIDCVAKETESRHSSTNDSSHHGSTVDTNTHLKGGRKEEGENKSLLSAARLIIA